MEPKATGVNSRAEELFVQLFCEAFGPEKTENLQVLYMISNFVLVDRVQSMAGMSISVDAEIQKTGKNYLKRKV